MDNAQHWFQSPAGGGGAVIGNSLRFRGAQNLNHTAGTPTDNKKWTWSAWAKISGASQSLNFVSSIGGGPSMYFGIETAEGNSFVMQIAGPKFYKSTPIFRDPSAWYNFVFVFDSANATQADRSILYVNGARQAATTETVALNQTSSFNAASAVMRLGYSNGWSGTSADYFSGYLTETHFIDGQALDPTSFGEFNADGVWVPKKVTGLTYGTNGFYLDYSDPASIGKDRSGNNNDWTATGFELTTPTSSNYDWMADSPTTNYCTLNPLDQVTGRSDLSNGNLQISTASAISGQARSTMALPSSGKHYFEATVTSATSGSAQVNVGLLGQTATNTGSFVSGMYSLTFDTQRRTVIDGTLSARAGTAASANDVIQVAVDMSTGNGWVGHNNTWIDSSNGTTGNPATGTNPTFTGLSSLLLCGFGWAYNNGLNANFGQRAFAHTPPAGFEPLSTAGLPASPITNPSDHFTTILDTGANILTAAQAKFPNGLWWIKDRANVNQNQLVDSVSGTTAVRQCPANTNAAYAAPAGNSVAWCWATPASGINTTAGFSITNGTHGLGVTPAMVIDRQLNVWHESLTAGQGIQLYAGNLPLAQTWTVNATTVTGPGGGPYWTWSEVPGYSSFGKYVGNGNPDGPFVSTGFKPAFVMVKLTTTVGHWVIADGARSTHNPVSLGLYANFANAENGVAITTAVDFTANGFKLRTSDANWSSNTQTLIYAAFAEHPFGGSNVSPSPAR